MKIAWFTPFDQRSAIGKVGVQICQRLAELNNEVDIWAYETKDTLITTLNVIHYNPKNLDIDKLKTYDHVIYNMGNFAGYHWPIYESMMQFPGVLIIHDRSMHNFFCQYCDVQYGAGTQLSQNAFNKLVQEEYGNLGKDTMEAYPSSSVLIMNEFIARISFLRKICENATAVFTHSKQFSEKIRDYSVAPTSYSYLPCEVKKEVGSGLPKSFVKDSNKLLVVSTGIVHPVKHIQEMVNAMIADQRIKENVQYVVIGSYGGPYGEELKHLAEKDLRDSFYLLGYQPDSVMESFLNAADICLNLRYPNSEVCSLSLLEQMAFGKPVIVYDSGIFGEMPDNSVYKIQMDNGEDGLREALLTLINNDSLRKKIGNEALRFITQQCTLDSYCMRLVEFLNNIGQDCYGAFYKRTMSDLNFEMAYLGYNMNDIPDAVMDVAFRIAHTLNAENTSRGSKKTIAIWAALPYTYPGLHREGIMKLNSRLVEALMNVTDLSFEVWTYDTNYEEVKVSFNKAIEIDSDRIKIITESNWHEQLVLPNLDRNLPWKVSVEADNLGMIARRFSDACIFVPVILYLDNVLQTNRPIYVPAMDMSVKQYYEEFTFRNPNSKFQSRDIEGKVSRMFRRGMKGYCMSQSIKDSQILPLLLNSRDEDIGIVWTPDMTSVCEEDINFSEEVLERLGITRPYLFYPTQFRPNKNISTLMKAFMEISEEYPDLKLVLTGHLEDIPDLESTWKKHKSFSKLVLVKDLSEEELFNVYHYASCIPVTTMMEGGFPAQAIEGMKMNVPIVLANSPVVRERLEGCDMTEDSCGLALFEPEDAMTLATLIKAAINNPDEFKECQKQFWNKFSQYTWNEAAKKHFDLMMKAVEGVDYSEYDL